MCSNCIYYIEIKDGKGYCELNECKTRRIKCCENFEHVVIPF